MTMLDKLAGPETKPITENYYLPSRDSQQMTFFFFFFNAVHIIGLVRVSVEKISPEDIIPEWLTGLKTQTN